MVKPLKAVKQLFAELNVNQLSFRHASEDFIEWLSTTDIIFNATPLKDHFDYCYLTTDLATLSGNKYHKNKNHINQFIEAYSDTYRIELMHSAKRSYLPNHFVE